jgi:multiple sugar transport system ATP-binding protein
MSFLNISIPHRRFGSLLTYNKHNGSLNVKKKGIMVYKWIGGSSMSSVTLDTVQKNFGTVEVVRGINLEVADGEFCVLLGPSGCGKSTLLRMIAGLEDVTSGQIKIDECDVTDSEPDERNIAMVFQSYALYPHMTVSKNMAFALSIAKKPKNEIDASVNNAANILGLNTLLDRYPRELSGGQRQRVAMGRAIVRNPAVFLFDEPLSNLDAKLRIQMRVEISRLHKRLGSTAIYVTHDQTEAMTMADRIVIMNEGRIEQIGTPLEIYNRPSNQFVASFIGSPGMNFLNGYFKKDTNIPKLVGDGFEISINKTLLDYEGQALTIGIRPEDITINSKSEGIKSTVILTETLGRENLIYVSVSKVEICIITQGQYIPEIGSEIYISIEYSKLHLFLTENGARIS